MTPAVIETQKESAEQVIEIDRPCETTLDLVRSEKFAQFFRIMNKEREGKGGDSSLPDTYHLSTSDLQYQHEREKAYEFWKEVRVRGKIGDIERTNTLVEELKKQLEALEKLHREQSCLITLHDVLKNPTAK